MNGKEQKDTSTCLEKDHGTSLEKDHGDLSIWGVWRGRYFKAKMNSLPNLVDQNFQCENDGEIYQMQKQATQSVHVSCDLAQLLVETML